MVGKLDLSLAYFILVASECVVYLAYSRTIVYGKPLCRSQGKEEIQQCDIDIKTTDDINIKISRGSSLDHRGPRQCNFTVDGP